MAITIKKIELMSRPERKNRQKKTVKLIKAERIKQNWLLRLFSVPWKITLLVFSIAGGLVAIISIYDRCKSPQLKMLDEFDEGDLKPDKISTKRATEETIRFLKYSPLISDEKTNGDTLPRIFGLKIKNIESNGIFLNIGNTVMPVTLPQLSNGIEVSIPIHGNFSCSSLRFGYKDERIYISTEFSDLQKEETIGIIEYNHWKLFKKNRLIFYNDERRLEVRDLQNNIVFGIEYKQDFGKNNWVYVSGYFISPETVSIIATDSTRRTDTDTCISKSSDSWKVKSATLIKNIKTFFPEKH